MEISEISATDMTALAAQGYTENDLSMLAKSEVASLLAVPADDYSGNSSSDPHGDAAAAQDAANAATTATAQADDVQAATSAPETQFIPQYSAEVPVDVKEQIAALTTEEREAFKKLMAGDLEPDAYQEVRARTEEAKDDLKTQALTANIFEKANAQASEQVARNEWTKSEAAAMTAFKADGLDYRAKPALLAAYNTNLKALGADPKNENRDAPWFLAEAHRLTKDDLGIVGSTKNMAQSPANTAHQVRNSIDPKELPPTLRSVPVAATGAVNADEFVHMRNLEGIALERAHAALTDSQRDRWMAE